MRGLNGVDLFGLETQAAELGAYPGRNLERHSPLRGLLHDLLMRHVFAAHQGNILYFQRFLPLGCQTRQEHRCSDKALPHNAST